MLKSGLHACLSRRIVAITVTILGTVFVSEARSVCLGGQLRAGAAVVDISPPEFPVIRNGGFIEAQDTRLADPIHARALVLDDGQIRLALAIVDSCMIPVDVCDQAKQLASARTGIPTDRILIAATHTHSAPSVMDYCLGSRADPKYREYLPGKIADCIAQGASVLTDAELGWGVIDAADFTKCRRWITRPDKMLLDPFGDRSVRAMMHPGTSNPEYVGPAGPVDPWLSVVSVRTREGQPLALLANFSMHYFGGHDGVSADYFGLFARICQQRIAPDAPAFVAMMSQGTSGDLWWGDYSLPALQTHSIEQYTRSLADLVEKALKKISHQSDISLSFSERRLQMGRRLPDEGRLNWARRQMKLMGPNRPSNQPEVYAEQAVYLHENPTAEVVLQVVRLGDVLIAAMPNEVFALTGLKIKAQSPLAATMNIELANGADGYIPPPEQHALGGYTTWPARTAGLVVDAEPAIVENILQLMEEVSGQARRSYREPTGHYAEAVIRSKPVAFWRCGEQSGNELADSSGGKHPITIVGNAAFHLPGVDFPDLRPQHASHAIHLAGGHLSGGDLQLEGDYSVELWCWNGLSPDVRGVTGLLWSHGNERLRITGHGSPHPGRLELGGLCGETPLAIRAWHHVVLIRSGSRVAVHLNGNSRPELEGELPLERPRGGLQMTLGGSLGSDASWEGRLDEIAVYDRVLPAEEIATHFRAAEISPSTLGRGLQPRSLPQTPTDAMRGLHVPQGFCVELVAAEPLIRDPVAIDWGFDGSLWVAEMADYPLGIDGKGKPGGRLRVLRDSNGDGQYDVSTVFKDGLSFPNGVLVWGDGVLITAAPEVLFAKDTDGDDRADVCQPLFSGFVDGNQQLRMNGLRWGLDNWIHCASGAHHAGFGTSTEVKSIVTNQVLSLGSRDFRIRPDRGAIEPESGPSQFGRVRNEWGDWFGVQNSLPLWHYVLADRYLQRNPRIPSTDPRKLLRPMQPRVYPAKAPEKRYHGFDHVNHYTSACGPAIYGDDLLFGRKPGVEHAFTCEPFHNLVQHHVLTDEGVSYSGERAEDGPYDFFASEDRWCRPVMARGGPDGALWVVDMYRYMIEHPEFLPPEGKSELEPFYRHGEEYGRIYRVVPENSGARTASRIDARNTESLLEAISHPSMIVRDMAHREFVRREDTSQVVHLRALLRGPAPDQVKLQAACVLDGLQSLAESDLLGLLDDPNSALRRNAIRMSEQFSQPGAEIRLRLRALANDPSPKVRLQLACSLGEWTTTWAGEILADLAARDDLDGYSVSAIISSMVPHYETVARKLSDKLNPSHPGILAAIWVMGQDFPEPFTAYLEKILRAARNSDPALGLRVLGVGLRAGDERGLSPDSVPVDGGLEPWSERALTTAEDSSLDEDLREVALELVGRSPNRRDVEIPRLAAMLGPDQPPNVERATLRRLLAIETDASLRHVLNGWPSMSHETRGLVLDRLMGSQPGMKLFLERMESKAIFVADIDMARRGQLLQHPIASVRQRAEKLFSGLSPERQAVVDRYQQLASVQGNRERGAALFEQHCATCHNPREDQSTPLGPDLRSLTDRDPAGLLVSILDPSRSVEPRYLGYNVVLDSGEVLFGVVANETANSLMLRSADGKERPIARESIVEFRGSGKSFMPDGFEETIKPEQMADIVEFVRMIGRID